MFVSPTPTNTPYLNAAGSKSSPEHVVIEVAAASHNANGMPALQLPPSVHTALTAAFQTQSLGASSQYTTRNVPGSGNDVKNASALVASHSFPGTPCRE